MFSITTTNEYQIIFMMRICRLNDEKEKIGSFADNVLFETVKEKSLFFLLTKLEQMINTLAALDMKKWFLFSCVCGGFVFVPVTVLGWGIFDG
jgi:hypothetical protein